MDILLKDEEIQYIISKGVVIHSDLGVPKQRQATDMDIAKAQLKKVAQDLKRKCTKTEGRSSFLEVYIQSLLKEVE